MAKRPRRKPTDPVQFKLRIDESLRARIEDSASKNNRSMNLEIVHLIESALKQESQIAEQSRLLVAANSALASINEQISQMWETLKRADKK